MAKALKEALPAWDLGDFYASPDDAAIDKDFAKAGKLCAAFAKAYEGKVSKLTGAQLGKAIAEYEVIAELLGKVRSYAS